MQYLTTKREMDSRQKSGYYTTILSSKENCSLWSTSTAKHFASSLKSMMHAGSLIRFSEPNVKQTVNEKPDTMPPF